MRLFDKSKIVYVEKEITNKLVVVAIEDGKPICFSKSVTNINQGKMYYENILGVLVSVDNNTPIVTEEHAYQRVSLQVTGLLKKGVTEDMILGFSCYYTDSSNLSQKVISDKEFKTMKKAYKSKETN